GFFMNGVTEFAEKIINFQKKNNLTDADVAFGTHLSVEKIHRIKENSYTPTDDDLKRITDFMKTK
ncbi:LBP_cg2779 family protein, partial [Staphylococcus aureus]